MIVVTGRAGAEVMGMTALAGAVTVAPVTPAADAGTDGATVGIRVIVDGMAVTMPGFWGTQVAQIPVK